MTESEKTIYDFSAKTLQGKEISLKEYQDQVILIINTASQCGFTPQYKGLQKLHEEYESKGLKVLGFPCNQFGNQEPGDNNSISEFCSLNYGVSFQMFEKIDVKGEKAHPLFIYLVEKLPGTLGKNVKWNFTKFLIDQNGIPQKRYAPTTKPEDLTKDIDKLLK